MRRSISQPSCLTTASSPIVGNKWLGFKSIKAFQSSWHSCFVFFLPPREFYECWMRPHRHKSKTCTKRFSQNRNSSPWIATFTNFTVLMCFWLLRQTVWFLVFLIITSFQSSSVFIFFSTLRQMPSLSLVYITNHHVILITLLHPADLWQSARNPYSAVTDVQVVHFTSCWCSVVELCMNRLDDL